ncbi:MAG: GDSL-type esterase/lipase family protein [Bacilli bacterium]|nr:GDSL-type esterase/lipase family protein [Bacilli bacterium]MDD4282356.1 GDSL-type esterase/lipase family protein [Bacilli bacterium]MDD4718471.1 GDSL-type esterase/lipase family protein [Bacilli bacterium]
MFINASYKVDEYELVGLGDSITTGYGVNYDSAYLSQVGNYLKEKFLNKKIIVSNKAINGQKSNELLQYIKSDNEIRTKITNADLIVVSIGGNDFLNIITNIFDVNFNEKLNVVGNNLLENMDDIYNELFSLNQDTKLIVIPLYNPYTDIFKKYPNHLNKFNDIKSDYLNQINSYPQKIYSPIIIGNVLEKDENLVEGLDPHPNIKGHNLIATEVIQIIDDIYEVKIVDNELTNPKKINWIKIGIITIIVVFVLKVVYTIFRK